MIFNEFIPIFAARASLEAETERIQKAWSVNLKPALGPPNAEQGRGFVRKHSPVALHSIPEPNP